MKCVTIVGVALLISVTPEALTYEITTHALISQKAYERSTLNPSHANSIAPALGFDRLERDYAFDLVPTHSSVTNSRRYFDDRSGTIVLGPGLPVFRFPEAQEGDPIRSLVARGYVPGANGDFYGNAGSLNAWLMRGAIREDDNDALNPITLGLTWSNLDDRDDDPHGPLLRATKHFYDPFLNIGYPFDEECETYGCLESIKWAIGEKDPLSASQNIPEPMRRNHFTWVDARNNLFMALTTLNDSNGDQTLSAEERLSSSRERVWRYATAIKSLGHVIHLLQDAAQPQHVRSDAHAPPRGAVSPSEAVTDAALEAFTDYRVLGDYDEALSGLSLPGNPLRLMNEDLPPPSAAPRLEQGSYPGAGQSVQFSTPVKYFTTRHVDVNAGNCGGGSSNVICARRGLADFSNRNFFSSGTLPFARVCANPALRPSDDDCPGIIQNPYPYPPIDLTDASYSNASLPSKIRLRENVVSYAGVFRSVNDSIAPSYVDQTLAQFGGKIPLLTVSATARAAQGLVGSFNIGRFQSYTYANMQYIADVEIPRAIGYSAGMINFFFRGRLKVEAPVDGLFAAIDQGIPHTVDGLGYPKCSTTVNTPENWCLGVFLGLPRFV